MALVWRRLNRAEKRNRCWLSQFGQMLVISKGRPFDITENTTSGPSSFARPPLFKAFLETRYCKKFSRRLAFWLAFDGPFDVSRRLCRLSPDSSCERAVPGAPSRIIYDARPYLAKGCPSVHCAMYICRATSGRERSKGQSILSVLSRILTTELTNN